ncbi:MAG: hypothetical protein FJX60_18320 [Alphaproteobacteria bacterium]|nr:hypothetical protein [Alphaproteobacteria bacterium]
MSAPKPAGPPKPEDATADDLELVPDKDALFAMRMGFYRGPRGRMVRFPGTKTTLESEEAQRQEGMHILDVLRKAGMRLYRFRGRWVRYGGEIGGPADNPPYKKWEKD